MFIIVYYCLYIYILSVSTIKNEAIQMENKTYYKEDLTEQAIEDLEESIKWNKDNEEDYEIDDLINETANNNIPIYTYDLLQYASNNFDLIEPNDLVGENPDVTQIISANIYEILTEELYNYINKREGE